jgi:hypothetical protein
LIVDIGVAVTRVSVKGVGVWSSLPDRNVHAGSSSLLSEREWSRCYTGVTVSLTNGVLARK